MDHIGIDVHKKDSQICILTEEGELIEALNPVFDHGRDQPSPGSQLFHQRRSNSRARGGDGDPVVGTHLRVAEAAVSLEQDDVVVAGRLEIALREGKGQRIDLDRDDQAGRSDDFSRDRRAIARARADLEEPVALVQAERLVEQRIAVRARDRRGRRGAVEHRGSGRSPIGTLPQVGTDQADDRTGKPPSASAPAPGESDAPQPREGAARRLHPGAGVVGERLGAFDGDPALSVPYGANRESTRGIDSCLGLA